MGGKGKGGKLAEVCTYKSGKLPEVLTRVESLVEVFIRDPGWKVGQEN